MYAKKVNDKSECNNFENGKKGVGVKGTIITGSLCVDGCIDMKRTDEDIDGVAIGVTGEEGRGCWCERKMTSMSANSNFQSCYLHKRGEKELKFL